MTKYNTLEEVTLRKEELHNQIQKQNEAIGTLWGELTEPKKAGTKGELISNIISNAITAFDAFMLVKKLTGQYRDFFGVKSKKKKKTSKWGF